MQRLARDLAERVSGHERRPALAACQRTRRPHHQPPLRQHLQPPRAGRRQLPLRLAERDDEEAGAALEAVEPRDLGVRLVDRLRPRERTAAEVHEVAAEAALHHPVGRDRGVDAAGEQDYRAAARPDRESAAPGELLGIGEDLVLVDLEIDLEVG